MNLFAYVGHNPIGFIDPLGLVKVVKAPTREFGIDKDSVVAACGGRNVNGCVLGLTKPVSCTCHCNGVAWQAAITVSTQYVIYYATGLKDIPADVIRAAEWNHVSELELLDQQTIANAESFENFAFPSRFACRAGCAAFKAADAFKRWMYLAGDLIEGHDVE